MPNEKEQTGMAVELDKETAMGSYSNLAVIAHSPSEFIIDFLTMLPGLSKPRLGNRIIMTPENAKRLMLVLQNNIASYENENGEIKLKLENHGGGMPFVKGKAEA